MWDRIADTLSAWYETLLDKARSSAYLHAPDM
jgi:hypothetical protein